MTRRATEKRESRRFNLVQSPRKTLPINRINNGLLSNLALAGWGRAVCPICVRFAALGRPRDSIENINFRSTRRRHSSPMNKREISGEAVDPPPAPQGKCNFWMAQKARHCRFDVSPGKLYCGNHIYIATQQGERHVPCPVDPTHTVCESRLNAHVKKCTKYKANLEEKAQPFYSEDINAGSGDDPDLDQLPIVSAAKLELENRQESSGRPIVINPFFKGRAAYRAAYAQRLGDNEVLHLISKIEAVYTEACNGTCPIQHVLLPEECKPFMLANDQRRYCDKHGLQQASILGNMKRVGLLPPSPGCATLELGAGTGYLSLMLAECYGASSGDQAPIVLVDRRGFRRKADRMLRQRSLVRVKIDIKNLDIEKCPGVKENTQLQGEQPSQLQGEQPSQLQGEQLSPDTSIGCAADGLKSSSLQADTVGGTPWLLLGKHLCGAATDFALRCCIGTGLGEISPDGQKATSEVTMRKARGRLHGLAVAPCCHHSCGWRAYVGKDSFKRWGFTVPEFELISWMTGWALCGHAAPAGMGAGEEEDGNDSGDEDGEDKGAIGENRPKGFESCKEGNKRSKLENDQRLNVSAVDALKSGFCDKEVAIPGKGIKSYTAGLSREHRIAIGSKCKQLIDQGRYEWLQRVLNSSTVELVSYCEPEVSGENRLLVAAVNRT